MCLCLIMIILTLQHLYPSECPQDPNYYARTRQKRARAPCVRDKRLTWCVDDLRDPDDGEQPDSTAAEPLEGPPVPRCSSHSSAGRISTSTHAFLPLLPWHLFRTFPAGSSGTSRRHQEQQRLVCQVVSLRQKKKKKRQKIQDKCVCFSSNRRRVQRRRSASSLRLTSGTHIASGRANNSSVTRLKGRRQIPQWGAATGGDMLSLPLSLSLSLTTLCLPLLEWPPGGDNPRNLCHLLTPRGNKAHSTGAHCNPDIVYQRGH